MIRLGIVGISGFSGKVLLDILLRHAGVRVTYVAANSTTGRVDAIWPEFTGRTELVCEKFSVAEAQKNCDAVFLALPHTESMKVAGPLMAANKKVIDLSADYRLRRPSVYKTWYKTPHTDPRNLSRAVYGLPELFREKIRSARLLANPGCYPTAAILGLAPLVSMHAKNIQSIAIDAKSGVSGAGRKVSEGLMYCFVNGNFKAYRVLKHQHTPEIRQYLGQLAGFDMPVTFVPHLLPIDSGILETMYVQLRERLSEALLLKLYRQFYKTEPFVRIFDVEHQPEIRNVTGTNFCDIAPAVSDDGRTVVITSAIDNLVKGASGQAVQNLNLMFGMKETEGLL
jgi:N-acetyl-gamma-glutamyl-phosphate reductase